MFTKLLKHEWQATKGILALLCVIILIAGITIGSTMYTMVSASRDGATIGLNGSPVAETLQPMSEFAEVVCVLLIMAGVGAVAICSAGSVFFLIYRFYKRCFTDEGYLTFTLPVTTHQILLSSILNTVIGMVIVIFATLLAVGIAAVLFLTAFPENLIWADVSVELGEAFRQMWTSLRENADTFAALLVKGLLGSFASMIILMLALTIGAMVAKKHRILTAVAVYYGINIVISFCNVLSVSVIFPAKEANQLLSTSGIISLIVAVGGYFLMHHLTDKKLNLT